MVCQECHDGPATHAVYCLGEYECDVCIECALYLGSVGFDTYRIPVIPAMQPPRTDAGSSLDWDTPRGYSHVAKLSAISA
jgi:hypothetical protein